MNAVVTVRVGCAWKRFRELALFLTFNAPPLKMKNQVYNACVGNCLIYGCETRATRVDHDLTL